MAAAGGNIAGCAASHSAKRSNAASRATIAAQVKFGYTRSVTPFSLAPFILPAKRPPRTVATAGVPTRAHTRPGRWPEPDVPAAGRAPLSASEDEQLNDRQGLTACGV